MSNTICRPNAAIAAGAVAAVVMIANPVGAADFLIADWEHQIFRVDGETGQSKGVFAQVTRPTGMTYGPDGRLYVGSTVNDSIIRLDGETGAFIDTFVETFTIPETGRTLEPIDMHFGDDGNLYVATDSQKGGVVRFDGKTGEYLGRFIDVNAEVPGFNYVEGMDVGPDGDIYLSAETLDTVHRFDGKTGQLKQLVGAAFSIGRVEFGPDGNIYYCDWFGDTGGLLRRSTADGENLGVFADDISGCWDLAFGPDGRAYVVGFQLSFVFVLDGVTGLELDLIFVPGMDEAQAIIRMPEQTVTPGDLDGDGVVGAADLLILLGSWGPCRNCDKCDADLDDDCLVGAADLLVLLGNWGV